jgi:hypothetical protein
MGSSHDQDVGRGEGRVELVQAGMGQALRHDVVPRIGERAVTNAMPSMLAPRGRFRGAPRIVLERLSIGVIISD